MTDQEQFRKSWRDGLRAAGLTRQQVDTVINWHRDNASTLPSDPAAIVGMMCDQLIWKNQWPDTAVDTAVAIFGKVGRDGTATPPATPADDAATITTAEALLKKDATAYWRDPELRERYSEALERTAAAKAEPVLDRLSDAVRRSVETTDGVERFADMIRTDPRRYWGSTKIQSDHRQAIEAAIAAPAPAVPDLPWPNAPIAQPTTPGTTA